MSASRRLYEQRMVTRRDQEDRIENLSRYVSSHHTMKANARSEPRVEAIRRHRTQASTRCPPHTFPSSLAMRAAAPEAPAAARAALAGRARACGPRVGAQLGIYVGRLRRRSPAGA